MVGAGEGTSASRRRPALAASKSGQLARLGRLVADAYHTAEPVRRQSEWRRVNAAPIWYARDCRREHAIGGAVHSCGRSCPRVSIPIASYVCLWHQTGLVARKGSLPAAPPPPRAHGPALGPHAARLQARWRQDCRSPSGLCCWCTSGPGLPTVRVAARTMRTFIMRCGMWKLGYGACAGLGAPTGSPGNPYLYSVHTQTKPSSAALRCAATHPGGNR